MRIKRRATTAEKPGTEAASTGRELLERLVGGEVSSASPDRIALATLVELGRAGVPKLRLDADGTERIVHGRTAVELSADDVGRAVVVATIGNATEPIVLGVLRDPARARSEALKLEARLDGERVVIEAEREIVLVCGEASLTLSRDGKIRIHGTDVLSRSSGGQRIKGATVRIN